MKSFCGIALSVTSMPICDHQPISSSAACCTTVGGVWPSSTVTSLPVSDSYSVDQRLGGVDVLVVGKAVVLEVALLARGEQTVGRRGRTRRSAASLNSSRSIARFIAAAHPLVLDRSGLVEVEHHVVRLDALVLERRR